MYLISIIIIIIDQITKMLVVENLKNQNPIVIIEDFLQFNYAENYGAAFGILQNQQLFFIIITIIIILGILIYIVKSNSTRLMNYSLLMVVGGAVGNFIDRIRLGYVVDFIDVKFGNIYDYPVFNIADSFIVIGTFFLVFVVLTDRYEKS